MNGLRAAMIGFVALGGLAVSAQASDGSARVIGRAGPGLVVPMQRAAPSYELVQISTMHRHAVGVLVERDPIHPELVRLRMGNQSIYIDPDRKYGRNTGGIDEGHSIMRAQRAYHAMYAQNAYVIRSGAIQRDYARPMITPRAILLRPDLFKQRDGQQEVKPAPTPRRAPQTPRRPVAIAK